MIWIIPSLTERNINIVFVLCHCTANVTWVEPLLFNQSTFFLNILQAFILLQTHLVCFMILLCLTGDSLQGRLVKCILGFFFQISCQGIFDILWVLHCLHSFIVYIQHT